MKKSQIYRIAVMASLVMVWSTVSSQCLPDRHTTNVTDGWMSCEPSVPPTGGSAERFWIAYDFGAVEDIYDIHLWNVSHPGFLQHGVHDVALYSSLDGVTFDMIDTFSVPRADPSGFYEGVRLTDLGGTAMRHLALVVLSSHGGTCAGFGEIRIHTEDVVYDEMNLTMSPCENGGVLKNQSGGLQRGGQYMGAGVTDNGDDSFDFDPDAVGPGKTIIEYAYTQGGQTICVAQEIDVLPCGDLRCPDCTLCDADTAILYSSNIPSGFYHREELNSPGTVMSSGDVTLRGRQEVNLLPGFEVGAHSELTAEIRTCEVNELVNPGFEDNNWGVWYFWFDSDSVQASRSLVTSDFFEGSQAAQVEVTESHDDIWRANLHQNNIPIVAGEKYRISFALRGDEAPGMLVRLSMEVDPYPILYSEYISIQSHWQHFSYEFDAPTDLSGPARLTFMMAEDVGTYQIDQVRISKK